MDFVSSFIEGFGLGLGAAVPLGPINLLIMNEALRSYKKAVAIGFGAMSADVSYLVLILFGVITFLEDESLMQIFSSLGGVLLLYFAFMIFKHRDTQVKKISKEESNGLFSFYFKGYILTLVNPYTFMFWIAAISYASKSYSYIATILGLVFAITIWITIMPYFIYAKRELISDRVASIFAMISSVIIFYFAVMLLMRNII